MNCAFTLIRLLRRTSILMFLCVSLAISTAGFAIKVTILSTQVATMTTRAATSAVRNRKAIASAVARVKAKARLRRVVAAIPLAGIGAVGYFEREDFLDWQEDNPDRNFGDYSCEVASVSAEVVDEVLQELPELVRPGREFVLSKLPDCAEDAMGRLDGVSE